MENHVAAFVPGVGAIRQLGIVDQCREHAYEPARGVR